MQLPVQRQAPATSPGVGDRTLNVVPLDEFRTNHLDEIRETHPRAYEPWSADEDATLRFLFSRGHSIKALADLHGRRPGAIRSRLLKLELVESRAI